MKDGSTALQVDASERTFAQADAWGPGCVRVCADAQELAEELGEVGIVAYDEDVLGGGGVAQQALELGEGCGRSKGVGDEDLLLKARLGGDKLGGLQGALEGAGDHQVEAEIEGVEDVGELEALGLAVLVDGTLEIEDRIGARTTGTGVAKDEEVHCLGVRCGGMVLGSGRGFGGWKIPGSGAGSEGAAGSGSDWGSLTGWRAFCMRL